MIDALPPGVGVAWRPETAWLIDRHPAVTFTELIAENHWGLRGIPDPAAQLVERGMPAIPHGISLSLGTPGEPDPSSLLALHDLAQALGAPVVSEHVSFVRAGAHDARHLMPLPRTEGALRVLAANARTAAGALSVPFALENPAGLFEWPGAEMDAGTFLARAVRASDAALLLDVANLHASRVNSGLDVGGFLDGLPLDRLAYVHVAGGNLREGRYHDTHCHPVADGVREVLVEVLARTGAVPVLLEHDDDFPPHGVLEAEVDRLAALLEKAGPRKALAPSPPEDLAPPDPDAAAALATELEALLAHLAGEGPAPAGMDAAALAATRAALNVKFAREESRSLRLEGLL